MASFSAGYAATREQVDELTTILSIMRPHQSKMESKFIKHFLHPLKPNTDGMGNYIVRIGDAPVLWSCHIDTVHNYGGIAPVEIDPNGIIKVPNYSQANCLGADDGAGVWLMLQMIRAKRPGLYVFHRGEERGGVGSKYIATHTPDLLKGVECAIAFDRKDTGSIITHQFGGRCCSEDFSASLAKAIGLGMKSDQGGSFTDTASYTHLVGECTNVSVGYHGQHGRTEEQDLCFLLDLHQHMLDVDVKDFVYKRKPGEKEPRKWGNGWAAGVGNGGYGGNYGGYGSWQDEFDDGDYHGASQCWKSKKLCFEQGKTWDIQLQGYVYKDKVWDATLEKWVEPDKNIRHYMDTRTDTLVCRKVKDADGKPSLIPDDYWSLVLDYPEEIALMLEEKRYGLAFLHVEIRKHGGIIETGFMSGKVHDKKLPDTNTVCPDCKRLNKYCRCIKKG